jgi:hypothetical protein
MKVGDLVIAKRDYGNIKKDEICRIKSFELDNLVYVEYDGCHWYIYQLNKNPGVGYIYQYFSEVFYTNQEMRKMKLEKISKKKSQLKS